MLSGYEMMKHEFPHRDEGRSSEPTAAEWRFLTLEPALLEKEEPSRTKLHHFLDVARFVSFKIWRAAPTLHTSLVLLMGLIPVVF